MKITKEFVKYISIIIFLIIICFFFFSHLNTSNTKISALNKRNKDSNLNYSSLQNPYKNANLSYNIIKSENNTWGYSISLDSTVLIIQTNKPGIPGIEGFNSQEQAKKVAELVISKLRVGIMPPSISQEELITLGVH